MTDIITISLKMPMNFGSVNCYLVKTEAGYILIDTGMGNKRLELENKLESAGCKTGSLNLIVITHGDFDHIGNAAYLRNKYAAKIAMHPGDGGMAQKGDMFFNRKKANALLRALIPIFSGFKKADRFTPDIWLEEGAGLSEFGLEAQVLSIPGHSKGSIGILTAANDLFCGDLFDNTDKPTLNAIMDDNLAANASLERLVDMRIKTVYPGHGQPFPMQQIINQLINPRYAAG